MFKFNSKNTRTTSVIIGVLLITNSETLSIVYIKFLSITLFQLSIMGN